MNFNQKTIGKCNGVLIENWYEDQYQRVEGVTIKHSGKRVLGEDKNRYFNVKNKENESQLKLKTYFENEKIKGRRYYKQQQAILDQFEKMCAEEQNKDTKCSNQSKMGNSAKEDKKTEKEDDRNEDIDLNGYPENIWSEKLRKGHRIGITPIRDPNRPFDKITSNQYYL